MTVVAIVVVIVTAIVIPHAAIAIPVLGCTAGPVLANHDVRRTGPHDTSSERSEQRASEN
jgi:hypothetical protein